MKLNLHGTKETDHKPLSEMHVTVDIDSSKLTQKLDAIARHAKMLSNELKDIDAVDGEQDTAFYRSK